MNQTKKFTHKRWRLTADFALQGRLCLRVAAYWVLSQGILAAVLATYSFISNDANTLSPSAILLPSFVIGMLFLPVALVDMLSFSNRFAGPILNLRRTVKKLAESGEASEISLRSGDYFKDLAEDLNVVIRRVNNSKHESQNFYEQPHCSSNSRDEVSTHA